MKNLVYGVGVNNRKYEATTNGKNNKEYSLWQTMMQRCYDKKFHFKNPSYANCSVSDNFKDFSSFYEWCKNQIGFNVSGWQLDKDILIKDNNIYSEDFCCFVPKEVNCFFIDRRACRGIYPIGVCFDNISRKFMVRCCTNGKRKTLGRFDDVNDAFLCYKKYKEAQCKELANKWREQIDVRVYDELS